MADTEKHSGETSSSDLRTTLQLKEDQFLEDLEVEAMLDPPLKLKMANTIVKLMNENQINQTLDTITCLGNETAHVSHNKLAQVKKVTGEENTTQK